MDVEKYLDLFLDVAPIDEVVDNKSNEIVRQCLMIEDLLKKDKIELAEDGLIELLEMNYNENNKVDL